MKRIYSKLTAIGICLLLLSVTMSSAFAEFAPLTSNNNLSSSSQEQNRTSVISPPFTHVNNIVIFLRFPSTLRSEFIDNDSVALIDTAYNTGEYSLKSYINKMSYNELEVNTTYFSQNTDGTYYSCIAPEKIYYYCDARYLGPNSEGYPHSDVAEIARRKNDLIASAINSVKEQIEATFTADELDTDGDGNIDSIQIFADTREAFSYIKQGHLLWPQQSVLNANITILGKKVYKYNLNTTTKTNFSVTSNQLESFSIIHEFMHILGFPDTYDPSNSTMPVGPFDVMSYGYQYPAPLLQYMQREYCNWGTPIDTITESGTYTLKLPQYLDKNIDGGENSTPETAYIIKSPYSSTEFFVIQCAVSSISNNKTNGIIIYRINTARNIDNGNSYPNYLYIWHQNDTAPTPTYVKSDYLNDLCVFSAENNLTSVGKIYETGTYEFAPNTLYFSDGSNSGIIINNIGSGNSDTISFTVTLPAFLP